jgi:hypothetical protein
MSENMSLPMTHVRRTASHCLLLTLATAASLSAQAAPARLQLPAAARLDGQQYALEMKQDVGIDYHGSPHTASRAVRFQFGFSGSRAEAERVTSSLRIDSLRMFLGTPHGDQPELTHGLQGSSLSLTYRRDGREVTYAEPTPLIDFAEMGGALPLAALIEQVFPALSTSPVRVGESWEHWWVRQQVDGAAVTGRRVASRFTLAALETQAGKAVARIEVSTRADALPGDRGGAITANGFVRIRVEDGVVLEVSSEETVSGIWLFETERLPFQQTTRLQARNVSAVAAAPGR